MVLAATKRYTASEYLALEDKAEFKSEFINGEIIPMAGASANHNKIALNFCRFLPLAIGEQVYEIFISDMRLWLPEYSRYTYPDVMV
ncbi:MAG: Uma2 family endonuclease, partial [Pseudanabaena sp.]